MGSLEEIRSSLKSVSIFAETPPEVLADLASLVVEEEITAGQDVFRKGDPGNSMYIITHGRVRVHDGEMIINDLSSRDVFGEMAALDPEPRSATVTALEDTRLLCLSQQALYQMMQQYPSVTRGVIRIIAQRLRARMHDMAEDFDYIQQFSRLISSALAVEAGIYQSESLDETARRTDELGQLARVFQRMVKEVQARELRLKEQVAELRIEIDEARKVQQVAEITETDYFQNLHRKAQQLRSARPQS